MTTLGEEIQELNKLSWLMYDGETFSYKLYDQYDPVYKEELTDVIAYNSITLQWNEGNRMVPFPKKEKVYKREIKLHDIIDSILAYYTRQKQKPKTPCFFFKAYYNPFSKTVTVFFT